MISHGKEIKVFAGNSNPELAEQGKNPLTVDSKDPTESYQDFIKGEVRYASLAKLFPAKAEEAYKINEEDAKRRLETYKKMAEAYGENLEHIPYGDPYVYRTIFKKYIYAPMYDFFSDPANHDMIVEAYPDFPFDFPNPY